MKRFYFVAVFATLALLCGCSKAVDEGKAVEVAKSELSIGLPIGISRTAMSDEGKASWVEGDTFTLWAENRTGGFNINGADFTLMYYWHSYQSAVFTSQANALAEGDYTYYAVSPKPQSTNGLKATYTIPAEQNGTSFNGGYDIMVATPVEAEALSAEKVNNLALDFQHKMHTLKMTIAKNNFPYVISKLDLTFPSSVVGKVVVDAKNNGAAVEVSDTGNILTLNINKELNINDVLYAVVLPSSIDGEVTLTAQSAKGHTSIPRTFNMSKELKEGHITPMSVVIPDVLRVTTIRFSIGENKLGEAIQKLTIIDNNGANLGTFDANSSNTYDLTYNGMFEDSGYSSFGGRTFTARFESAHAIVEQQFTMPTIEEYITNVVPAIDVPYLFFEDFSSIHTNFDKDDYNGGSLMTSDGILLDNYMGVSGWNAAHVKGVIGQCVRVNVRHEYTMGATRTNGRLDSPAMKSLKAGANVTLKVEFGMGSYGTDSKEIYCFAGTHTAAESSPLNGWNETKAFGSPSNDASRIPSKLTNHCYSSGHIAPAYSDDSFGESFPTYSFTASGCTSETRFVWVPGTNNTTWSSIGNAHYYLYIDNIRVSIAQ